MTDHGIIEIAQHGAPLQVPLLAQRTAMVMRLVSDDQGRRLSLCLLFVGANPTAVPIAKDTAAPSIQPVGPVCVLPPRAAPIRAM